MRFNLFNKINDSCFVIFRVGKIVFSIWPDSDSAYEIDEVINDESYVIYLHVWKFELAFENV